MAATTRGKVLRELPKQGRDTCPICERTGIKLLYPRTLHNHVTFNVCKICRPKKRMKEKKQ